MKLVFFLFLLAPVAVFATPLPPAQLVLNPSGTPKIGSTFSVDIYIAGVTDLYSWQADVDYTPSTLSVVSFQEGSFLSDFGSTFFIPGTVDSINGVIANTADTVIGNTNGPAGGGLLMSILFKVNSPGTASIFPNNVILLDSNFDTINYVPAALIFDIPPPSFGGGGPSTSPEPGSFAFMVAGGGFLLLLKRRFLPLVRSMPEIIGEIN